MKKKMNMNSKSKGHRHRRIFQLFFVALATFSCISLMSCLHVNSSDNHPDEFTDSTVTDTDGNIYHTVRIGTQLWTIENLRTTKYKDSTLIPYITDSAVWCSGTTAGYCYYNHTMNSDSITKFGALYNWHAVNTGNLAPEGWHVPTRNDWNVLEKYLIAKGFNYDGTTTNNKIAKALAADTDWETSQDSGAIGHNPERNNRSGFSALPGGMRGATMGTFASIGSTGIWWSSDECVDSTAYYQALYNDHYFFIFWEANKTNGLSVRLVHN